MIPHLRAGRGCWTNGLITVAGDGTVYVPAFDPGARGARSGHRRRALVRPACSEARCERNRPARRACLRRTADRRAGAGLRQHARGRGARRQPALLARAFGASRPPCVRPGRNPLRDLLGRVSRGHRTGRARALARAHGRRHLRSEARSGRARLRVDSAGRPAGRDASGVLRATLDLGATGDVSASPAGLAATTVEGTIWLIGLGTRSAPARYAVAAAPSRARMRVRPASCSGRGGKQACLLTESPGTNVRLSAPRAGQVTISLRKLGSTAAGGSSHPLFLPAGTATYRLAGGFGFCHFATPGHACTPAPRPDRALPAWKALGGRGADESRRAFLVRPGSALPLTHSNGVHVVLPPT